ncbi:MAG: alanine racemase [Blastopirellula sp.]|nr:MAG: alanine racemase [Blastopirellula sp.]
MSTNNQSWINRGTEIETPFLLVDDQLAKQNIARIASYAAKHQLNLRPHTKTHKSKAWAQLQLESGAIGLTVAKAGEAEVMAEVCDDLLMAYPPVDAAKSNRLAALAKRITLRVGVDSSKAIEVLAEATALAGSTIGVLIDCDLGFHRTGVQTPQDSLALAQQVDQASNLRLDGIMFFPGDVSGNDLQQASQIEKYDAQLGAIIDLWQEHGLKAAIVSGGATPSAMNTHLFAHLTEFRPGTLIYNDCNTFRGGYCEMEDCAARIIATVISTAVAGKAVIDAGSKTLTSDRCGPALDSGHGHVCEYPEAKITRLSEEHGEIDFSACSGRPEVGDRLTIIPNHICPCVNLQDVFYRIDSDENIECSQVDARGLLS